MPASASRARDLRLADVRRRQRTGGDIRGERAAGLRDIPAAAVGHRHDQPQPGIARGERLGVRMRRASSAPNRLAVADEAQAHLIAVQIRHFALQCIEEQAS